jgi:hypothetical protein
MQEAGPRVQLQRHRLYRWAVGIGGLVIGGVLLRLWVL